MQAIYIFLSITGGNRGGYLVKVHHLYKTNKIVCLIINICAFFLHFLFYDNTQINFIVLVVSIIISGIILVIFDVYAKKIYYKLLKERILLIPDINTMTAHDIKVDFIKRYGEVYSILDIEKIISKLD